MNTAAQIRRATGIAHRAVESLDADAAQALIDLYRAQADDIAARIRAHAGPDDNLALQELRSLLGQVEGILQRLSAERDALLNQALAQAADYGARPVLGTVLDTGVVVASAASMKVAQDALFFVQTFMAEDGLQLSDRIWRLDRGARDAVANALESAIIQGHGAGQAAREFLARGAAVPSEVASKLNAANAAALSKTAQGIMTGVGSPLDNAMRVMRTEINRAHGEAYMMSGADHPDFAGWRFLLSPSHPAPDICDLLSTQNLYGLGEGVYPTREKCPWPAHPNTLSFLEIVFKDEITAQDKAGKETPLAALARLPEHKRAGVLGKAKAGLFEAGKLRQGMIRAPLKAVRARTGDVDPRDTLTQRHFNGEGIAVTGRMTPVRLPGGELNRDGVALLMGAPDGSRVHVKETATRIEFEVTNRDLSLVRSIFMTGDGVLHWNGFFLANDAPKLMGTHMAAITAETASNLGLQRMEVMAWGPPNHNGHYTWARLGFDAAFDAGERARLERAGFPGTDTVQALVSGSDAGRRWWREHGWQKEMAFDLDAAGQSMKTLRRYLSVKGIKLWT